MQYNKRSLLMSLTFLHILTPRDYAAVETFQLYDDGQELLLIKNLNLLFSPPGELRAEGGGVAMEENDDC